MKAARLLKAYLKKKKQDDDFELFDQVRLNEIMTHLSARKQYGGTLYISHGLNRYLQGPQFNKKKSTS